MRNDFISEITGADNEGIWSAGIFAIEHAASGRRYYVGTANVGRRLRDNRDWLHRRVHPNASLQADWVEHQEQFRFVLVTRTRVKALVPMLKQGWIDLDRRDHPLGPYNVKNAVKKCPKIAAEELSLPPSFLAEPQAPIDPFAHIVRELGDAAFNSKAWDHRPRVTSLPAGSTWTDRQEKLAFLISGLPSAKEDLHARVDELLRRVRQLLDEG